MTSARKPKIRDAREHLKNVRCSYMNDTRWRGVLSALAMHQVPARIKLLWDEYSTVPKPGAEVVVAYDSQGRPSFLEPQVAFNVAGRYWECTALGPFLPGDIEWLALHSDALAMLSEHLPINLNVVIEGEQAVIIGYEFMPS